MEDMLWKAARYGGYEAGVGVNSFFYGTVGEGGGLSMFVLLLLYCKELRCSITPLHFYENFTGFKHEILELRAVQRNCTSAWRADIIECLYRG